MKKKLNLFIENYLYNRIYEWVRHNYLEYNENFREKIIDTTLELYLCITNRVKSGKWTQIHRNNLKHFRIKRNLLGKETYLEYSFFINILLETELIFRNENYKYKSSLDNDESKESFCKSYKINDNIDDDYILQRNLNIVKVFKTENKKYKSKEEWIKEYKEQNSIIEMIYETSYDIDEVRDYLYSRLGTKTKRGKIIDNLFIIRTLNEAIKYNERFFNFVLTPEGRFYNPTSAQSSTIRHLLKWKGEYLIELDTKNSQPLLLSIYIKNSRYKQAVESGTFYDILLNEVNGIRLEQSKTPLTREQLKVQTLKYIFYGKNKLKSGALYKSMIKYFGDTINQINELKEDNLLWKILQEAEADIFIRALEGNYISIHDAILVRRIDMDNFFNGLVELYRQRGMEATIEING